MGISETLQIQPVREIIQYTEKTHGWRQKKPTKAKNMGEDEEDVNSKFKWQAVMIDSMREWR